MNAMRVTALLSVLVLLQACSSADFEGGTYIPMQQDFDKIRLDHLLVMSKLIVEFEQKTGHFPFANRTGDSKPVAVVIGSEEQLQNDNHRVRIRIDLRSREENGVVLEQPDRIEIRKVQELTMELAKVLERPIALPIDPQRVPVNKPSVYVYTCYKGVFDVSAYLHGTYSFARTLNEFNNKVTVGSRSNPESAIWTFDDLVGQQEFREFFQSPFNRGGKTLQTVIE